MHPKATLYLDESGKSSLAEKEDEPFIIAGVIIDDLEVGAVEGYFNYIRITPGLAPVTFSKGVKGETKFPIHYH